MEWITLAAVGLVILCFHVGFRNNRREVARTKKLYTIANAFRWFAFNAVIWIVVIFGVNYHASGSEEAGRRFAVVMVGICFIAVIQAVCVMLARLVRAVFRSPAPALQPAWAQMPAPMVPPRSAVGSRWLRLPIPRMGDDLIERLCRQSGVVLVSRNADLYQVRPGDNLPPVFIDLRYSEDYRNILFECLFPVRLALDKPSGLFARILLRNASMTWAWWSMSIAESCEGQLSVYAGLPVAGLNPKLFGDVIKEMADEIRDFRLELHDRFNYDLGDVMPSRGFDPGSVNVSGQQRGWLPSIIVGADSRALGGGSPSRQIRGRRHDEPDGIPAAGSPSQAGQPPVYQSDQQTIDLARTIMSEIKEAMTRATAGEIPFDAYAWWDGPNKTAPLAWAEMEVGQKYNLLVDVLDQIVWRREAPATALEPRDSQTLAMEFLREEVKELHAELRHDYGLRFLEDRMVRYEDETQRRTDDAAAQSVDAAPDNGTTAQGGSRAAGAAPLPSALMQPAHPWPSEIAKANQQKVSEPEHDQAAVQDTGYSL